MPIIFNIFLFFFTLSGLFAQVTISGQVVEKETGLAFVNVVLKSEDTGKLVAFTQTNEEGKYELRVTGKGRFFLHCTALGYEEKNILLDIDSLDQQLVVNVILQSAAIDLREVTITEMQPIKTKGDTTVFRTKYFTDGSEKNLEDLLQKIPGIQIDKEGTITVGNKKVESVMIEGDDLFKKAYKTLSKNMPAYPVEEIELLHNFSDNPLIKGIEEGGKVALNVKLNEAYKRIWFGNVEVAVGNNDFYQLKANVMNFGKKNKYFILKSANNIGHDETANMQGLLNPFNLNEKEELGDGQTINQLLDPLPYAISIKKSRLHFNNEKTSSINAVFNPSEKLKIKALNFLSIDNTAFSRSTTEQFNANEAVFSNSTDYSLRNGYYNLFGEVDINCKLSPLQAISSTTIYHTSPSTATTNLAFNQDISSEEILSKNHHIDQKINYTAKLSSNTALLLSARYKHQELYQNYQINRFFLEDLFPDINSSNGIQQDNQNQMQFAGIRLLLLSKKQKETLLKLQLGNEYRKDIFHSNFELKSNENINNNLLQDYQNQTTYIVNDLYAKASFQQPINKWTVGTALGLHQYTNFLYTSSLEQRATPFLVNPELQLAWKINQLNKLSATYSYSNTNAKISDVYDQYVLTSFRSFNKGTGQLSQLSNSSLNVLYILGDWSRPFLITTSFNYSKNHDFFSTNTLLQQNFSLVERVLMQNQDRYNLDTKINYFLNGISSNIKIDLGYSQGSFANRVNNSQLRTVQSRVHHVGIDFRSSFQAFFNFHLGSKWESSSVASNSRNAFYNQTTFLDLSFLLGKSTEIMLQTDRYTFTDNKTTSNFFFLDADINRVIIPKKVNLSLVAKNILDTRHFTAVSVSDLGIFATSYELLPRCVLLKISYRF